MNKTTPLRRLETLRIYVVVKDLSTVEQNATFVDGESLRWTERAFDGGATVVKLTEK